MCSNGKVRCSVSFVYVLCGLPISGGMSEAIQILCIYYMRIQFFHLDFLSGVVYVDVMHSHCMVRVCRVLLLLNSAVCINGKVCCSVSLFVCSLWMAYMCWFCYYKKTRCLVSPSMSPSWYRLGKLDTRPWIPRGGWSMMPVSCTSPGSLWLLARGDVPDALLSLTTLIGRSDWIGSEYSASDLAAYVDAFLAAEENGDLSVVRRRRKVWKRGILRSPE